MSANCTSATRSPVWDEGICNVNVDSSEVLPTPRDIVSRIPISEKAITTVLEGREVLRRILGRQDPRLFVVVGPCSIHDVEAAREYAERLKALAHEVGDTLVLVMRVYFEKPRTTTGWKGLINDPHLDDSFDIEEGLQRARRLLLQIAEMGLMAGTEALDPISPQYLSDLVSWYAIGARTTESQTHREMASGLSAPVGFKNGTDGSLEVAINALLAVSTPHSFLGLNREGQVATIRTRGNRDGHVVLRGGGGRANYDSVAVAMCEKALDARGIPRNIVIDCSHGNSNKDPALQPLVMHDCAHQIIEGNRSIVGLMLESHLQWGSQPIPADLSALKYGVSVTDACIDWDMTVKAILETRAMLKHVLPRRS